MHLALVLHEDRLQSDRISPAEAVVQVSSVRRCLATVVTLELINTSLWTPRCVTDWNAGCAGVAVVAMRLPPVLPCVFLQLSPGGSRMRRQVGFEMQLDQ